MTEDPSGALRPYRRRAGADVVAVRLDLETDGFTYRKWGGEQRCKAGDWVVENAGEVYTVDAASFAETYRRTGPGTYRKVGRVWAERARSPGTIETKESATEYAAGDYLVFNRPDRGDGYAIAADKFRSLYEPDEPDDPDVGGAPGETAPP